MEFVEDSYEKSTAVPAPATERPNVRALLIIRNIKQKDLAARHNLCPSEVSKVISGKRRTLHIRKAIAHELGMVYGDLWGEKR